MRHTSRPARTSRAHYVGYAAAIIGGVLLAGGSIVVAVVAALYGQWSLTEQFIVGALLWIAVLVFAFVRRPGLDDSEPVVDDR